jgi:hypothetical protein
LLLDAALDVFQPTQITGITVQVQVLLKQLDSLLRGFQVLPHIQSESPFLAKLEDAARRPIPSKLARNRKASAESGG